MNLVARDRPPNDILTLRILSDFPQLVPSAFEISHLPDCILSFARQAVELLETSLMREMKGQTKGTTDTGKGGAVSAATISTTNRPALLEYPQTNSSSSHGPSLRYTESQSLISQDELLESIGQGWREKLSAKQSARWLRRTSTVLGKAPFTNREIALEDCSPN